MKYLGTKAELVKMWRARANKLRSELEPETARKSITSKRLKDKIKQAEANTIERCADDLEMLEEPKKK